MMKWMIVSVIVVLAVALGLFLSSSAYGGFFSAFIQASSDAGNDAQLSGESADSDDIGFTIKMGSRSGGAEANSDDGAEDEDDETPEEDEDGQVITYGGSSEGSGRNGGGSQEQIVCNQDSDCGEDGYYGESSCTGNDLMLSYRDYFCVSPSVASSSCSYTDNISDLTLAETCDYKCFVDECVEDAPPSIDSYSPSYNPSINVFNTQAFSVDASDIYNDTITIVWSLDGDVVSYTESYDYVSDETSIGSHVLIVEVSDGNLTSTHEWNLTVSEKAVISIEAPSSVTIGETFSATIDIETVKGIYAAAIKLPYDEGTLEVLSVENGDFMNNDGQSDCSNGDVAVFTSFGDGLITYDATRCKVKTGSTGSGTLFTVDFKAIGVGETEIDFSYTKLLDYEELGEVDFEEEGVSVYVQ